MKTVIVADDSMKFNSKCRDFLTKDNNTLNVIQTFNGKETLKKYKEIQPDALILDYKLPKINGLKILDEINQFELGNNSLKRNVILVTGSTIVNTKLFKHEKVYRFFPKPLKNPLELSNTLNEIFDINDLEQHDIESDIQDYLYLLGVSDFKSNNYKFLKHAIKLIIKNPDLLKNLQIVYYLTGQEFNRTSKQMEDKIYYTVKSIRKNMPKQYLESIFGVKSKYDKFTSKLFLDMTSIYFSEKYKIKH